MSIEKVKKYLEKYDLSDRVVELDKSSATVMDAAIALKCDPKVIAKSLTFFAPEPIMVVTAGDVRIDNNKFKKEFGIKASMIPIEEVEQIVGQRVGGVCPFAVNKEVKIYLDDSLKRFDYVYPACGSPNSAIKISVFELEQCVNYEKWIDVCSIS